jgi:hypothetical protein
VLALRILLSAPLAFKKKKYGGTPPMPPPRMGCRPYQPRYFHPKVAATGWIDWYENERLPAARAPHLAVSSAGV